jgi:hypothetical protein
MSAYSKNQRPYNGPYSSDFDESKVQNLSRDAYYPSKKPGVTTSKAGPTGNMLDNTIDLAATIDPQTPFATTFDQGGGDYQREKSQSGRGGFTGPVSRSNNHPTRTGK